MKLVMGAIAVEDVVVFIPETHPTYPLWKDLCSDSFYRIVSDLKSLRGITGEYLFLISCLDVVKDDIRSNFKNCYVIHESNLPNGRGWSPLAYQVLEGKSEITISVIKCADPVDSGDIVKQGKLYLDGSELSDEINKKAFYVKAGLILKAIQEPENRKQVGEVSYYKRRTPDDSELDVNKSIKEQFNLLRICEPRFPAYFNHLGKRYEVSLKKCN